MWKKALIFVGGVLVGAAGTFFIMQRRINFIREDCESQIQDIKENYRPPEKIEKVTESEENKVDADLVEKGKAALARRIAQENSRRKIELSEAQAIIETNNYHKAYNAFSKPLGKEELKEFGPEEDGDDEDDDDDLVGEYPQEDIADGPYVIDEFDYINGRKMYDKITLNFYDDGVLEEEISEDLVDDIDGIIGRDALTKFGDDDMVFVRNERINTDYAVVRQHCSYGTAVPEDDS